MIRVSIMRHCWSRNPDPWINQVGFLGATLSRLLPIARQRLKLRRVSHGQQQRNFLFGRPPQDIKTLKCCIFKNDTNSASRLQHLI
jgi:hypothetical protein